jgi:hypothetical protein
MHLREAFWTKIARPIRGIMYHGWESLVPTGSPGGYRYTHPETQRELARLIHEVVQPLGPTLLQTPAIRSDVAQLQSFASEVFAGSGTWGWGRSWLSDAFLVLLYARLQPEIVFDETVVQRGLDGYRVLLLADCEVLTESVAARIREFQQRGGIVVGDQRLPPSIKPNVLLPCYQRTGDAKADKAALMVLAEKLRQDLGSRYHRYVDTDNPDVIPYLRRNKGADYVFLVNDRREYGEYVGHHGMVMENGLPSRATVSIGRPSGFAYDLVEHRAMPVKQQDGRLLAQVNLAPCDGLLCMIVSTRIDRVAIDGPVLAPRGEAVTYSIAVLDPQGRPVEAVVPMDIRVRDAAGGEAEFSGYHAAIDGKLTLKLTIAPNDPMGIWQLDARELASGRKTSYSFRVPGPTPWPPTAKPSPSINANAPPPKG